MNSNSCTRCGRPHPQHEFSCPLYQEFGTGVDGRPQPEFSIGIVHCARPAKITLFLVVDVDGATIRVDGSAGPGVREAGDYCIEHLHRERDRLKAEGKRTGVAIVTEGRSCCAVVDVPAPSPS